MCVGCLLAFLILVNLRVFVNFRNSACFGLDKQVKEGMKQRMLRCMVCLLVCVLEIEIVVTWVKGVLQRTRQIFVPRTTVIFEYF